MSLVARLQARVDAAPDAPALVDARPGEGGAWTVVDLWERAGGAATWLAEQGVGLGDRVVLLLPSSPDFVALVWGAWRLGAVVVPVEPSSSPRERRFFADHAGAALVIEVSPPLPARGHVPDTPVDERALLLMNKKRRAAWGRPYLWLGIALTFHLRAAMVLLVLRGGLGLDGVAALLGRLIGLG